MKRFPIKGLSALTVSAMIITGCGNASDEGSGSENGSESEEQNQEHSDEESQSNEQEQSDDEDAGSDGSEEHEHNHSHDEESDSHDHSHGQDAESERIYNGFFYNDEVEDRPLSDWTGDWQSVYPYLEDGTLDEVFAHKAEEDEEMSEDEYKEYYEEGYQTDVSEISIEEDGTVTFVKDGEEMNGEYVSGGHEILEYEAGNRGVRYIFELDEGDGGMPQYIQFSDHDINPTDAGHYHLYWGDDNGELLEEVENWPTYYPSDMDGEEITHEMIAH
ncbi:zinc transport system substrate-binding protein [Marinococcus luteus]|uniref:Zinc transport system substrate-binding protein n=1 Tax=Marinococcus luteus TaxID=1122204 RepID=A0A1H2QWD5_9BACI|nr:ZinT/AdcA family metal-binding protein [Marinococcus luteus]SDW11435.1 zinc transport system substrate-binding protein [Marinococcus luteus]